MIAIPVGIIAFVKFFGENRYSLPIYYEEAFPEISSCGETGTAYFEDFLEEGNKKVTIIFWEPDCESNKTFYAGQLTRVKANFQGENFLEYYIVEKSDSSYAEGERTRLAKCALLIDIQEEDNLQNWQCDGFMVMLDWKMRIRGYYSGADFEDIDRLILELHVMQTIVENEEG